MDWYFGSEIERGNETERGRERVAMKYREDEAWDMEKETEKDAKR